MAELFKALGDPTRLEIIALLTESKNLCVNVIAEKTKMSQPAISQHLKILKNAGICSANKIGAHVHYSLNDKKITEYQDYFANLFKSKDGHDCTQCPQSIMKKNKSR
ncbi:MAG: metalloregulator ArsR/SmtB family transcription factor [Dehalococcoidales bacterium]|jgi:DNA-binding transcriptional ArsR family regulator